MPMLFLAGQDPLFEELKGKMVRGGEGGGGVCLTITCTSAHTNTENTLYTIEHHRRPPVLLGGMVTSLFLFSSVSLFQTNSLSFSASLLILHLCLQNAFPVPNVNSHSSALSFHKACLQHTKELNVQGGCLFLLSREHTHMHTHKHKSIYTHGCNPKKKKRSRKVKPLAQVSVNALLQKVPAVPQG